MTMHRMFDAANPPPTAYPGSEAVAGYIGGRTPHVWKLEEWQRFGDLRQLPIWVHGLSWTPEAQAVDAADAAVALGWKPRARTRRAIVLDMETTVDEKFVAVFAETLHAHGFGCWVYGSAGYVFGNPPGDGYWVADYDGEETLDQWPGKPVKAKQFRAEVPHQGGNVDLSVISDAGMLHLGRGPRQAPA